jgi:hypothetical protein
MSSANIILAGMALNGKIPSNLRREWFTVSGERTSKQVVCLTCVPIKSYPQFLTNVHYIRSPKNISITFDLVRHQDIVHISFCIFFLPCLSFSISLKHHILAIILKRIVAALSSLLSQQCLLLWWQRQRIYYSSTFVLFSKSPLLHSWRAFTAGR